MSSQEAWPQTELPSSEQIQSSEKQSEGILQRIIDSLNTPKARRLGNTFLLGASLLATLGRPSEAEAHGEHTAHTHHTAHAHAHAHQGEHHGHTHKEVRKAEDLANRYMQDQPATGNYSADRVGAAEKEAQEYLK